MLIRVVMLLTGFALAVSGGISTIAYLNMLPAGYSFVEYASFIISRLECYLLPAGLLIVLLSIYLPDKNEDIND